MFLIRQTFREQLFWVKCQGDKAEYDRLLPSRNSWATGGKEGNGSEKASLESCVLKKTRTLLTHGFLESMPSRSPWKQDGFSFKEVSSYKYSEVPS